MAREIETRCLHLEEEEGSSDNYGAISYPIYQTATYAHPGVGKSTGYDYTRLQNPTREHLEKTVASLESGIVHIYPVHLNQPLSGKTAHSALMINLATP